MAVLKWGKKCLQNNTVASTYEAAHSCKELKKYQKSSKPGKYQVTLAWSWIRIKYVTGKYNQVLIVKIENNLMKNIKF